MELFKSHHRLPESYPTVSRGVVFIPKRRAGDEKPWVEFGSSPEDYRRWVPEICGICCLKMVGDTLGATHGVTLYDLTMQGVQKGVLVERDDGTIGGAYHHPLVDLAREYGIPGRVVRNLTADRIVEAIEQGKFAMVSVDLARVEGSSLSGGHLLLVYGFNPRDNIFGIHDCASLVRSDGEGMSIPRQELATMSNHKGVVLG